MEAFANPGGAREKDDLDEGTKWQRDKDAKGKDKK
jgi:hypothetical protein